MAEGCDFRAPLLKSMCGRIVDDRLIVQLKFLSQTGRASSISRLRLGQPMEEGKSSRNGS